MVGIEGEIRLLYIYIPLQLINIMITIILVGAFKVLLFFVLSLSQLSHFGFLKMPTENKRIWLIYLL